ncbi:MAG TPA: alpha-2-macroglobulin, partial [Flavisolibacter sp.]
EDQTVEIKLGNVVMNNSSAAEKGTGYFKKRIEGAFVKPEMSAITVTVKGAGSAEKGTLASPSWGAVYWQYFEDLDLVSKAATPLSIDKQLFVEKNSDRGPVITPLSAGTILKPGDKIKVRIELKVDRDMEYVHMKDLRASALEPVNVISGYKWQGGLGYYESTKDISTSFYFSYLRRGTYVFEYPLFVTHTGNFSNGITTVQSMYAPEFSAHSQGTRITVE